MSTTTIQNNTTFVAAAPPASQRPITEECVKALGMLKFIKECAIKQSRLQEFANSRPSMEMKQYMLGEFDDEQMLQVLAAM